MRLFIALVLFILCTACQQAPVKSATTPRLELTYSDIGDKHKISVQVKDKRTYNFDELEDVPIEDSDIDNYLYYVISDGLEQYGFSPVSSATPVERKLEIDLNELRMIVYREKDGTYHMSSYMQIETAAKRRIGGYHQIYNTRKDTVLNNLPAKEAMEEILQNTIQETLLSMFNDVELLKFLVR